MVKRVGVCRALHAYRQFDLWHALLKRLGCETVLSDPTDRRILASGSRLSPAELCLPVKAFVGHALSLVDRVDALLVPRLVCRRSNGRFLFGCPKSLALPDMTRALLPGRLPLVETTIDERVQDEMQSLVELARRLGCRGNLQRIAKTAVEAAGLAGCSLQRRHVHECDAVPGKPRARVGVIGHVYLLNDLTLSRDVVGRLAGLGVEPVLPRSSRLPTTDKPVLDWLHEAELISEARRMVEHDRVSGLVLASSFACGTAPVTSEIIRRSILPSCGRSVPTLTLTFDEHTGDAGLLTRLESFVDLLHMKRAS